MRSWMPFADGVREVEGWPTDYSRDGLRDLFGLTFFRRRRSRRRTNVKIKAKMKLVWIVLAVPGLQCVELRIPWPHQSVLVK